MSVLEHESVELGYFPVMRVESERGSYSPGMCHRVYSVRSAVDTSKVDPALASSPPSVVGCTRLLWRGDPALDWGGPARDRVLAPSMPPAAELTESKELSESWVMTTAGGRCRCCMPPPPLILKMFTSTSPMSGARKRHTHRQVWATEKNTRDRRKEREKDSIPLPSIKSDFVAIGVKFSSVAEGAFIM